MITHPVHHPRSTSTPAFRARICNVLKWVAIGGACALISYLIVVIAVSRWRKRVQRRRAYIEAPFLEEADMCQRAGLSASKTPHLRALSSTCCEEDTKPSALPVTWAQLNRASVSHVTEAYRPVTQAAKRLVSTKSMHALATSGTRHSLVNVFARHRLSDILESPRSTRIARTRSSAVVDATPRSFRTVDMAMSSPCQALDASLASTQIRSPPRAVLNDRQAHSVRPLSVISAPEFVRAAWASTSPIKMKRSLSNGARSRTNDAADLQNVSVYANDTNHQTASQESDIASYKSLRGRPDCPEDPALSPLNTERIYTPGHSPTKLGDDLPARLESVPHIVPSALKGSPTARKGPRLPTCVRISTTAPDILHLLEESSWLSSDSEANAREMAIWDGSDKENSFETSVSGQSSPDFYDSQQSPYVSTDGAHTQGSWSSKHDLLREASLLSIPSMPILNNLIAYVTNNDPKPSTEPLRATDHDLPTIQEMSSSPVQSRSGTRVDHGLSDIDLGTCRLDADDWHEDLPSFSPTSPPFSSPTLIRVSETPASLKLSMTSESAHISTGKLNPAALSFSPTRSRNVPSALQSHPRPRSWNIFDACSAQAVETNLVQPQETSSTSSAEMQWKYNTARLNSQRSSAPSIGHSVERLRSMNSDVQKHGEALETAKQYMSLGRSLKAGTSSAVRLGESLAGAQTEAFDLAESHVQPDLTGGSSAGKGLALSSKSVSNKSTVGQIDTETQFEDVFLHEAVPSSDYDKSHASPDFEIWHDGDAVSEDGIQLGPHDYSVVDDDAFWSDTPHDTSKQHRRANRKLFGSVTKALRQSRRPFSTISQATNSSSIRSSPLTRIGRGKRASRYHELGGNILETPRLQVTDTDGRVRRSPLSELSENEIEEVTLGQMKKMPETPSSVRSHYDAQGFYYS